VRPLSVIGLLDLTTFFGGHSYDTGSPPRVSTGDDGGGGIGTAHIVAVALLALVTAGLMLWLSPSGARAKLRPAAPAALMAVIVVAPLALWAASPSGGDEKSLIVERATDLSGAPELIVYLGEDDLNTLRTTNGEKAVRVECRGRDGQVILDARQRWPFVSEPGYDYPHVHQAASFEQLQRADRCRLRGTRVRLEGQVEGPVRG
jgi:hypothetical protein